MTEERPARYYATLCAGLERIAGEEIGELLPGARVEVRPEAERGRVFFTYPGLVSDTFRLRSVENVFAYIGEFEGVAPEPEGLEQIRRGIAALDLQPALRLSQQLRPAPVAPSFRCSTKRAGTHDYTSLEVMAAAGAGVWDQTQWRVDLTGHDYDIHADLTEDWCLVGLRLTTESLRRRTRVVHTSASLNPTVAYAMCRLSEPVAGEFCVDPMCGGGTVLIERAVCGPALLAGGDLFAHPVAMTARNLEAAAAPATLFRWDARALPLATESVDKIISNPPWGRRAGSHTANRHIYPGLVRELARVLRVGGVAVVLSLEKALLTGLVERNARLRIVHVLSVAVGGLHPSIYVVKKTAPWRRPVRATPS